MRKLSIVATSAMFMAAVAPAFAADAGPAAGAPDTSAAGTPATGTTGADTSGAGTPAAGATGTGTGAGTPAAGATGTETGGAGTPAAGTTRADTSGAPTPEQYQILQGRLDALQKQLDAINTANGAQTPLEAAQGIQKQLDDLKAAIAKAKAGSAGVSYGKFTLTGLAQVWIGVSTHPDPPFTSAKPPATPGGTPGAVNTNSRPFQGYFRTQDFGARLRRMEVGFNNQIDPKFSFHGMADFTRDRSTHSGENGAQNEVGILQDLFMQYDVSPVDSIYVGQLKLPLTEIGLHSSAHLPTIERPLFVVGQRNILGSPTVSVGGVSHGVTAFNVPLWGDIRETGVQFRRTMPMYSLQLAITQGAGDYQNATQLDYGKQFTGQFLLRPNSTPDLQLGITGSGGSGYLATAGSFQPATPAGTTTAPAAITGGLTRLARIRGGGSILWQPGRFFFESEYMAGADGVGVVNGTSQAVTAIRHGEYGIIGYDLGGYKAGDGFQAVAQADYWDPGFNMARQTNYTLGLNHDMDKGHHRLQLNYVHQHYDGGIAGTSAPFYADADQLVMAIGANW